MTDDELEIIQNIHVSSISIGFSAKRTQRNPETDEFRTFEAHETWNINVDYTDPAIAARGPDLVKKIGNYWTPKLIAKVYFALFAVGAMRQEDLVDSMARIRKLYSVTSEKANADRTGTGDIPDSGNPIGSTGAEPTTGPDLPVGQDAGLPPETGSSPGSPAGSESGLLTGPSSAS